MSNSTDKEESRPTTDSERLKILTDVFAQQKIEAIAKMKHRGVATVRKICEIAGVDHTYLYDKKSQNYAEYEDFRKSVLAFEDEFKRIKNGVAVVEDQITQKYSNSLEDNLKLTIEKNELRHLLRDKNIVIERLQAENASLHVVNTNTRNASSQNQMSQNTIQHISPDKGLQYNGKYEFYNEELKERAWREAKAEFIKLMRRDLPTRLYILIGLPCAGKTTWCESLPNIYKDRHAVIIDATSLTVRHRSEWLGLARKARNVRTCAVRFVVDFTTLRERNALREGTGKRLDLSVLEQKEKELEEVDVLFEDFDEILIVRED
jgi:23S rRNA-/tRNA-specific pseudouridylate synthase